VKLIHCRKCDRYVAHSDEQYDKMFPPNISIACESCGAAVDRIESNIADMTAAGLEPDGKPGVNDVSEPDPVASIVEERRPNYGPPERHFPMTNLLYETWLHHRKGNIVSGAVRLDPDKERSLRHGMYIIFDKIVHSSWNPEHVDNYNDIGDYAQCLLESLRLNEPKDVEP